MKVRIGKIEFRTKAQAEVFVRRILQSYGPCVAIDQCSGHSLIPSDQIFVGELLKLHRHHAVITKGGISDIRVQHLNPKTVSRFFLIAKDGSWRDFSWHDAIYPRSLKLMVHRVCRSLVSDQILYFKTISFGPFEMFRCHLSGEMVSWDLSNVHHDPDFDILVRRWMGSLCVGYEDIEIVASPLYQEESTFLDPVLTQTWKEYHKQNAKLFVVSTVAHRALPRKTLPPAEETNGLNA